MKNCCPSTQSQVPHNNYTFERDSSNRINPLRKNSSEPVEENHGIQREISNERAEPGIARRRLSGGERRGQAAQVGRSERAVVQLGEEMGGKTRLSVARAEPRAQNRRDGVGVAPGADAFLEREERRVAVAEIAVERERHRVDDIA